MFPFLKTLPAISILDILKQRRYKMAWKRLMGLEDGFHNPNTQEEINIIHESGDDDDAEYDVMYSIGNDDIWIKIASDVSWNEANTTAINYMKSLPSFKKDYWNEANATAINYMKSLPSFKKD